MIFSMPWYIKYLKSYRNKKFNLLDVGCGNHSATKLKQYFRQCSYYGIDINDYNNNQQDYNSMEKFFQIDLTKEPEKLTDIENNCFDAVIISHVLEHLPNGLTILPELIKKIKKDGIIFIEFPGIKSLSLPNMYGTLNFSDDYSHVRVYHIAEIANVLMENGFRIIRAGKRRVYSRIVFIPMIAIYHLIRYKKIHATLFWDLFGFAEFVCAKKII